MEYVSVSSSTISAIGYEEASNTLGVRFHNGTEYHYFGVPQDVLEAMRSAPSVGRFFDHNIKKAGYGYARVA
jgi:KTSC domain-containing protein